MVLRPKLRMERGEVDVSIDHKPGPILSDSSTSSSSIPPSNHSLPPPHHSGSPRLSAPSSAPASIRTHPFSAPQGHPPPSPLGPPPISGASYPSTRPPTAPPHITTTGPPGHPSHYQSYGPPVSQHSRPHHSQELSASRPTTAAGHSDPHRPDWPGPNMDGIGGPPRHPQHGQHPQHSQHPPPPQHYPPHPGMEQMSGMPGPGPPNMPQYPVQPSGQGHPPPPQYHDHGAPPPGYPGPQPYSGHSQYGDPSYAATAKSNAKKSARAQQACNNCRMRKQKCDEQRPCSYCKGENVQCEYKEVPPPKADKHTTQLLEEHRSLKDQLQRFMDSTSNILTTIVETQQRYLSSSGLPQTRPASRDIVMVNGIASPEPSIVASAGTPHDTHPPEKHHEITEVDANETTTSHHTGAHYLMRWKAIGEIFREANVNNEDYVSSQEEANGQFRLFNKGSSGDNNMRPPAPQGMSPAASSDTNSVASYPYTSDEVDAHAYNPAYGERAIVPDNLGGLNTGVNGSIRLDDFLIRRLYDSYMSTMWVIFPIFNAVELKRKMDYFIARYSPQLDRDDDRDYPHSPHHHLQSITSNPQIGSKRKYSASEPKGYSGKKPRYLIDHTLSNAVVLLVLALGSLCEYDDFLMQEDLPSYGPVHRYPIQHGSPSGTAKYSPTQASVSMSSPQDYDSMRSGIGSRGSSIDRNTYQAPTFAKSSRRWNVEKIPGLAYWTEAAQILGEWHGSRDFLFIQAHILAGLYWGQIGKVLKSHSHVKIAADLMVEISKKNLKAMVVENDAPEGIKTEEKKATKDDDILELLLFLFWTVYKLEGDIRAELDHLPASGIQALRESESYKGIKMPTYILGYLPGTQIIELYNRQLDVSSTIMYFSAQLSMRTLLNSTHKSRVYTNPSEKQDRASDLEEFEFLWTWLKSLRPFMQWDDSEAPPTEFNAARYRAKFYGAAYINLRPYLYKVLYPSDEEARKLEEDRWDYPYLSKLGLMEHPDDRNTGTVARRCIIAALHSTVAFDGLLTNANNEIEKRPKLTNIQGTMAAQFGNMLVVTNAYIHDRTCRLVPEDLFFHAMKRTIQLLHKLSPVSPVFMTNYRVLIMAQRRVARRYQELNPGAQYHAILEQSPRPSNMSMTAPGTPQFYENPGSAATSFSAPR